ncbi:ubiquitin-like domain-containing protein [Nocardia sp. A7]|uniref:ubiquitin-like domain-containing protein n=1 Tax=Nocardia sp. A7 TaxID=2789274 RepID=UPI00397E4DC8
MRVQHHARHTLRTRLRRGVTVGLIAAAMAVPVAGIVPVTASAQPAPPAAPAPPALPALPALPAAPAAPAAPEAPAVPGAPALPGLGIPGAPLAETASSITLSVQGVDGTPIPVSIDATATVEDLKIILAEETGIPADEQRLIIAGGVELEDSRTLASYELTEGADVNLAVA